MKIREEIDSGVVEDAELGQQMYQVSVYPRKEQECVLIEHDHIPSASLHPSLVHPHPSSLLSPVNSRGTG